MTTLKNLRSGYLKDRERQTAETIFFIKNGYMERWNQREKENVNRENGARRYCTETRWNQYTEGKITFEKLVEYTIARTLKKMEKETAKGLERIARIEAAPDLDYISLNVAWGRPTAYGRHPHAIANTNNGTTTGTAGGWGYDKESAAVAEAFNNNDSILKVLYTLKEKGLSEGMTSESKTACTGNDNRNIIGYGAGYSFLPYFEGGVGVSCFWSILKKAGYTTREHYGQNENFYNVYRAGENAED